MTTIDRILTIYGDQQRYTVIWTNWMGIGHGPLFYLNIDADYLLCMLPTKHWNLFTTNGVNDAISHEA